MSDSIDVGSVIGGRYNVLDHVLTTGENDQVFNGMDQVLNRPVSILVAAPENATQLAASARDLAMGVRPGNMSILDLGTTGNDTYLITSRTDPTNLLELTIPLVEAPGDGAGSVGGPSPTHRLDADQHRPAPQAPAESASAPAGAESFVEPYYTDTLGSEIFGTPREAEPEPDEDGNYIYAHYEYPSSRGSADAGAPASFAETDPEEPGTAPTPLVQPATGSRPKVTDYDAASGAVPQPGERFDSDTAGITASAGAAGAAAAAPQGSETPYLQSQSPQVQNPQPQNPETQYNEPGYEQPQYSAPQYDGGAVASSSVGAAAAGAATAETGGEPAEKSSDSKGMRLVVGLILAALLVVGVFLAVNQLGSLLPHKASHETSATPGSTSGEKDASGTSAPAGAKPKPVKVTRVITGGIPDREAEHDNTLPALIDGDPKSAWVPYMYNSNNFGNYYSAIGLVFELQNESPIKSVTMDTPDITGGQFEILVNSQPNVEGAQKVGSGSFSKPKTTVELKDADGKVPHAKYVIVNITQLPNSDKAPSNLPFQALINEVTFN